MTGVVVDGSPVPAVGLGTWRLEGRDCRRVVSDALAMGYRHLDTAQRYGNEQHVGAALGSSPVDRDDVFLTTKLDIGNTTRTTARTATESSLRNLRTDHVDLLLIHWPEAGTDPAETLEVMAEMQVAGMVTHLGVCNFPPSLLERACAAARIVTDQVEYHPYLSQDALLDACAEHDMVLTAFAPLARGRVAQDEVIRDVARQHGRTPVQVALRWLVQQPRVVAIPKASSPERLQQNLDIFDFELTADEMVRISGLDEGRRVVNPPHAPDWER